MSAPIDEVIARIHRQAAKAQVTIRQTADELRKATSDNAKCRAMFGVSVPTLIQWGHGEFDTTENPPGAGK